MDGGGLRVLERSLLGAAHGRRSAQADGNAGMKLVANIIGVVLIVAGAVLVLGGQNVLHGAAISGQVKWTGWGAFAIAFGAGFLVWANRERPAP
jgi:hypothetical protein